MVVWVSLSVDNRLTESGIQSLGRVLVPMNGRNV